MQPALRSAAQLARTLRASRTLGPTTSSSTSRLLSSPFSSSSSSSSTTSPIPEEDAPPPPPARTGDFRSDTVTKPTPQMYISMLDADVGDDVYGEDASVRGLERTGAALLEKEAALFVPSATMANLIAVGVACARGEGIILGDKSHIFNYEQGGASWLMGAVMHTVPNKDDGKLFLGGGKGSVEEAIESRHGGVDPHYAKHACVAVENTHNLCGGTVLDGKYMDDIAALCAQHELKLHVDGARLMNAAAALNVPAARLVRGAHSVSLCLSKGLGAPVGALYISDAASVTRARRLRKALGGGMRQAGVIAAPGLIGLKEHAPKLAADHAKAKSLARGLAHVRGVVLDSSKIATNIVFFDLDESKLSVKHALAKAAKGATIPGYASAAAIPLSEVINPSMTLAPAFAALIARTHGCKIGSYGTGRLRAVTHHQVIDEDVDRLIDGAAEAAKILSAEL